MSRSTWTDEHKHNTPFKTMRHKKVTWQDKVMLVCHLCSICFTICWSADTKLLNTCEAVWTFPASHLHTVPSSLFSCFKLPWNLDLLSQQKTKRQKTEMHNRIAVPKLSLNMENVKLATQRGKQLTRSFFLCAGTQSNWGRTGNNQTLDPHIILAQIYRYQKWCRCWGEEGREWV